MSKPTFAQRCTLSEQCLPDAPYRAMLTALHSDMLREIDKLMTRNQQLERELTQLAESVAQRLEQAGAGMQAGLIREVFIQKSHP